MMTAEQSLGQLAKAVEAVCINQLCWWKLVGRIGNFMRGQGLATLAAVSRDRAESLLLLASWPEGDTIISFGVAVTDGYPWWVVTGHEPDDDEAMSISAERDGVPLLLRYGVPAIDARAMAVRAMEEAR
ncbi:MAG: hypothetical protein PHT12_05120, partial [Patescibacteria group bacterium]|nr:hypothetical protein [Patescibacteria group bacterium]